MKKVIVTGGAGFIGSNLVKAFVADGFDVHVVDNFAGGRMEGRLCTDATLHETDIRDLKALFKICEGAEYIFHLAALPRVQDSIDRPIETNDVNVNGTLAVLEAARHAGVKKVVFSSSAAVYGDQPVLPLSEDMPASPKSPYGLHKYLGERSMQLWSELYGVPTVSLRYFNVYGPGFDPNGAYALVVGKFLDQRKKGLPLPIAGDGSNTRDYVHVNDVVRANILAAQNPGIARGEVFNIGAGVETSVNEIAAHVEGPVRHVAPRIEPARCVADVRRAKNTLGWTSTIPLERGIADLKAQLGLVSKIPVRRRLENAVR